MKIKKLLITSLILTFLVNTVYAKSFWNNTKEVLKDYGIPCALAIGASHLLAKDNKMAIGVAACAGASSVTYLKNSEMKEMRKEHEEVKMEINKMNTELKEEVKRSLVGEAKEEMVMEMKQEIYGKINESLKQDKQFIEEMLSGINKEFSEYKGVIDQVLAQKLVDFRGEISVEVEKALMEGPFIELLEKKLKEQLKDDHEAIFSERKKEMVKKCVEDTLDEIVVKEIGVQK